MWNQSLIAKMLEEINVAATWASRLLRADIKCPI